MAHLRIHQLFSAPFLLSPNYQLHVFSIVVHFQLRRRVFYNFSFFNKLYVCRRSIFNERLIRTEWDQRDKRSPVLSEIELIHARLKGGMERHPTFIVRKSTERRRPLLRETATTGRPQMMMLMLRRWGMAPKPSHEKKGLALFADNRKITHKKWLESTFHWWPSEFTFT